MTNTVSAAGEAMPGANLSRRCLLAGVAASLPIASGAAASTIPAEKSALANLAVRWRVQADRYMQTMLQYDRIYFQPGVDQKALDIALQDESDKLIAIEGEIVVARAATIEDLIFKASVVFWCVDYDEKSLQEACLGRACDDGPLDERIAFSMVRDLVEMQRLCTLATA